MRSNMIQKHRFIWLLAFFCICSTAAADLKIGYVNVPMVLDQAPQAERAKRALEDEFAPRDKLLVSQSKEVKTLEEQLSRDGAIMSESERSKLERDIISKKRDIRRSQEEFREDFNMRRNEELGKLQKEIFEAIRSLAKEENYDLLLTDGVVHASEAIDVTKKIQQKLKDRYK